MANLFSQDELALVSMSFHGDKNKTAAASKGSGDQDDDLFDDYMLALQLQMQNENFDDDSTQDADSSKSKYENDDDDDLKIVSAKKTKDAAEAAFAGRSEALLVDPEFDLIDPCPDIRALFMDFDKKYFWNRLGSCLVEWSKRMTICAGIFYLREGGIIRLSEPLLKYRPRRDLVQTLLHEMIHAYLYLTRNFKDRGEHGDEFKGHMDRINRLAGTNITVYHTFHDEVNHARQHVWRCTGPCRTHAPFYGYVKRSMNRAPGKNDTWWSSHQSKCNGQFEKVAEPESYKKKKGEKKLDDSSSSSSKLNKTKASSQASSKKRAIDDSTLNAATAKIDSFFAKKPKTPSPTKSSSSDDDGGTETSQRQSSSSQSPVKTGKIVSSIVITKKPPQIDVNQKRLEFFYSKSQLDKNSFLKPLDSKVSSNDLSAKAPLVELKKPALVEIITPSDDVTILSNSSVEMIDDAKSLGASIVEWAGDDDDDDDDIKLINEKLVECPVCAKKVDESNINVHVNQHFS